MAARSAQSAAAISSTEPASAATSGATGAAAASPAKPTGGDVPSAVLEARELEHRRDLARMQMQLMLYRATLEEHGIAAPDLNDDDLLEMYRGCYAVITTASEFTARLGSAKEMLARFR